MTDFSSSRCLFQSEGMESEMSIKNLEAQNAQVRVAILELAKGQEELKALIIKKKKKPKGSAGVSHLRRKIKIPDKKFTSHRSLKQSVMMNKMTIKATRVLLNPLSCQMKKMIILETNRMMKNTNSWKIV